jgi:DNA-binding SARP family transcriptional activator
MYVSGVRRTLTDAGYLAGPNPRRNPVLQTKSYGYQLLLEGDVLDLDRFRELAAMGRDNVTTGDCGAARSLLTEALALWRGPAMADIRMIGGLDHYASSIDEERLSVVRQSIEVELCGQRPHGVVGMLEQLCRTYPMREDLHRLLMTALHQTGRQVEALRVYANARQIMIEEAGVEPGPALRAAQQAIFDGRELAGHTHEAER